MEENQDLEQKIRLVVKAERKKDEQIRDLLRTGGIYVKALYYRRHRSRKAIIEARKIRRTLFSSLRRNFVILNNMVIHSDSIGADANVTPERSMFYREGDLGYRLLAMRKL